jgi:hypothetical protein
MIVNASPKQARLQPDTPPTPAGNANAANAAVKQWYAAEAAEAAARAPGEHRAPPATKPGG